MYRLKAAKYREDIDPRDLPAYTPADAAQFLGIKPTTLSHWVFGRRKGSYRFEPLIEPADRENKLLSFYNLAELHILAATRYEHKIKFHAIRTAIEEIKKKYPSVHPLIARDFFTDGKDLFIKTVAETENMSSPGKLNFKSILDMFIKRVGRDKQELVDRIFPVIKGQPEDRIISIVYGLASGQPVVAGRGIPVFVIYGRRKAGESTKSIATDFGISEEKVKRAIDYVEKRPLEKRAA